MQEIIWMWEPVSEEVILWLYKHAIIWTRQWKVRPYFSFLARYVFFCNIIMHGLVQKCGGGDWRSMAAAFWGTCRGRLFLNSFHSFWFMVLESTSVGVGNPFNFFHKDLCSAFWLLHDVKVRSEEWRNEVLKCLRSEETKCRGTTETELSMWQQLNSELENGSQNGIEALRMVYSSV